jgi:hypothetical protein
VKKKSKSGLGESIPPADASSLINQPLRDWIPFWQAPYFCTRDGRMHVTRAGWTRASELQVRKDIDFMRDSPPDPDFSTTRPCPQWDVRKNEQNFRLTVSALGVHAWISPGTIFAGTDNDQWSAEWTLASGDCNDFLRSEDWNDIPETQRHTAEWLRRLLKNIFRGWEWGFRDALRSGAARLMATKNSVLQPFEQIVWDQWIFFKLDDPQQNLPDYGNRLLKWYGAHKWEYSVWGKSQRARRGPRASDSIKSM